MSELSYQDKRKHVPCLWFVIPCYNEEPVIPITAPMFLKELEHLIDSGRVSADSKIAFVNDGSTDSTWQIIEELARANDSFVGLSLSRNRGHQNALLAGLMEARSQCDITISVDCDGQDDITAATKMVDAYLDGAEIVYGVRSNRDSDTAFKRGSAENFYRLMKLMGAEVVFNHADYRLISSKALDELANFGEVNLFLRGLVPMVGFKTAEVYYTRTERIAGESHYPLGKMLGLALDGITSLSVKPMRIIMGFGAIFFVIGIALAIWAIITAAMGNAVAGWTSTICLISVIGGLQLLALGIIGEYVGKTYLEAKRRPRYIIEKRTWEDL
ncbi:MAG: glycosyltransferase family 2 protein [Eggerthellaceae bacterium]|nr:glycosyltransferase family 2 protein [Eggerthellaceae bacterium]